MDPWGLAFINEIEDNTAEKVKQIVFVIDIPSVVSLTDLYIWALRGVLTTKQSRPKNRDCHAPFGRSQ